MVIHAVQVCDTQLSRCLSSQITRKASLFKGARRIVVLAIQLCEFGD